MNTINYVIEVTQAHVFAASIKILRGYGGLQWPQKHSHMV